MYLNCHSFFSLRYGTMSVEELVRKAKAAGATTLALTDINTTMAMMYFIKACNQADIQPIAGVEFRNGSHLQYVAIARNNQGFAELNRFLTRRNNAKVPFPSAAPDFEHCYVIYPLGSRTLAQLKHNEYVGLRPQDMSQLVTSEFANNHRKLVLLFPITHNGASDYELHLCLRAIDNNVTLPMLRPGHVAEKYEYFFPLHRLRQRFGQYADVLHNTEQLMNSCSVGLDFKSPKNKKHYTGNADNDQQLLARLAMQGIAERYGLHNQQAQQRATHELQIIHQLGFSGYFLITWDMVSHTRKLGIPHVGRGSGANSVVAYALHITDVDPIELDLYFERFLNPKRTSPPDFDIDYSWKDRHTVHSYLFNRYGHDHVALLGATGTFQGRAALRELGKVYGLPKEEIDGLTARWNRQMPTDSVAQKVVDMGQRLLNFPNVRSIHAGGVLISEKPLTDYVALDMPPKGYQTTQWDMYTAEMIGFEKLDVLSQRGIGHIQDCIQLVAANRGETVSVADVETIKNDPDLNRRLYQGETIGCFYIESPAMRGLLKKLRCNNYLGLVAASSIIRPGVAKSGMMREYIKRFNNPGQVKYLHPVFEQQLRETFGVMVYQEDVIKICHHFAGLDLADADILRRAMSGKYRSSKEFDRIRETYFVNCCQLGHSAELAQEVWRQIASFAGYAFSKAHSASYAVESYQSLYLKTRYPLEFMVAVINNFGGFYQTHVYVNEAKLLGGRIQQPCVNNSEQLTAISHTDIYLGFVHVKGLEQNTVDTILTVRKQHGHFVDFNDFAQRAPLGLEQLKVLVRVGALRFTGQTKQAMLWKAHLHAGKKPKSNAATLFAPPVPKDFKLPPLQQSVLEDAYDELELLGFPVSLSPFDMLQTNFRGEVFAKELSQHVGKSVRILGDLVNTKQVRTENGKTMYFGCFFDVKGHFFDTVHFPPSLLLYPFTGYGIYLIVGQVVEEFGFASIEVQKFARLPLRPDGRFADKQRKPQNLFNRHPHAGAQADRPFAQRREITE